MNPNFLSPQDTSRGWKPIEDPKSLHDWIMRNRERERNRYRITWGDWIENLAAFHGHPDVKVSTDLRLVKRLSTIQEKELDKYVTNFIQPHVRDLSAKVQKARPRIECVPATSDESDAQTTKCADKFIQSEWEQQEMDMRRLEESMWKGLTGNSFWHNFFDRDAGPTIQNGIHIGQLSTEVLSPFKLVVEPHRNNIDKCRWSIHDQMMPMDWVQSTFGDVYQEMYGKPLRITKGDSAENHTTASLATRKDANFELGDLLSAMIGIPGRQSVIVDDDFITLCVFYHLPTHYYPRGFFGVATSKEMIYVGEFPHHDDKGNYLKRLPLFHFKEILCPWRFHGETGTTNVRYAQAVYIELRNLELEYLRDGINFKWLSPKGMSIDKDALLSKNCELVEYVNNDVSKGLKPERTSGTGPPDGVYKSFDVTLLEMNRSGGINQASQGTNPAGVDSGRALLSLQEQDDTRLGTTVQIQEREYGAWGTCQLFMAKIYYTEKRRYTVVGEGLSRGLWFFDRAELGEVTDVVCQPGSSMPKSKYAQQEMVMKWFQQGILGDPAQEATKILARKMSDIGSSAEVFDDDAQDSGVSEQECNAMLSIAKQLMSQGIQDIQQIVAQASAPVSPWDNHMIHIRNTLRCYRREGVRDNPILSAVLATHLDAHKYALQPPQPAIGPDGQPTGAPAQIPPPIAQPGNAESRFNEQQIQDILAAREQDNTTPAAIGLKSEPHNESNPMTGLVASDQQIKPIEGGF